MGFLAAAAPLIGTLLGTGAAAAGIGSAALPLLAGGTLLGAQYLGQRQAKKQAAKASSPTMGAPQPPRPPQPFGGLGSSPFTTPGQSSVGGTFLTGSNARPTIGAGGKGKTLLGQ